MEMLSERYGWTPAQIRDMDVVDIVKYMQVIHTKRNLEQQK